MQFVDYVRDEVYYIGIMVNFGEIGDVVVVGGVNVCQIIMGEINQYQMFRQFFMIGMYFQFNMVVEIFVQ